MQWIENDDEQVAVDAGGELAGELARAVAGLEVVVESGGSHAALEKDRHAAESKRALPRASKPPSREGGRRSKKLLFMKSTAGLQDEL